MPSFVCRPVFINNSVDTTPNQFTFTDQSNVALSAVITSAAVTILGINAPSAISVTGGTYSINGGAFTSSAGTANNFDQVQARHTSSGSNSTATNTVVTVGGVSDTFTSTTQASSSFDYYIGPSGSDANPGTSGSPWAITAINTKRATYGGKTVGLLDGTYSLITVLGQPSSGGNQTNRLSAAAGTSSNPTIIKAVNRWLAIIDYQRTSITPGVDPESASLGPNGDWVVFDGIYFTGANYNHSTAESGQSNVTWQNCFFTDQFYTTAPSPAGKNSGSIKAESGSNLTIRNCWFEMGGAPSDSNRHAFYHQYACDNTIIEYCTVIGQSSPNPSSNGLHFKGNEGTSTRPGRNCTIRYCYVYCPTSTNSAAAVRWHGSETSTDNEPCHHNILVGANGGHPFVSEGGHATRDLYNLTVIGGGYDCGLDFVSESSSAVINITDCITSRGAFIGSAYGDVRIPANARIGTSDYNLWDSSPAMKVTSAAPYASLAAWQAASSQDSHSSQTTDPLFVGTGTEAAFYVLQAGSAGKTLGAGGTEVGAWSSSNTGPDAFGIGYSASRS